MEIRSLERERESGTSEKSRLNTETDRAGGDCFCWPGQPFNYYLMKSKPKLKHFHYHNIYILLYMQTAINKDREREGGSESPSQHRN